jgi:signal transduction histidine kinase
VTVRLRYGPEDLSIVVTDDGVGPADGSNPAGHGLVGMRERAALYGGRVEAGPLPGRGFRVSVTLPVVTV